MAIKQCSVHELGLENGVCSCDEVQKEREHFEYLDNLRESGVTNMFGAGVYLAREFNLSKSDATKILGKWIATFGERHPKE